MDSIGLSPGHLMAFLAGGAEFFGGLALIIGLLVRPASAVLAFAMLIAIFSVHIGNGLFMSNNGYEFGLALLAVSVSLVFSGAGRASIDRAIDGRDTNASRLCDIFDGRSVRQGDPIMAVFRQHRHSRLRVQLSYVVKVSRDAIADGLRIIRRRVLNLGHAA